MKNRIEYRLLKSCCDSLDRNITSKQSNCWCLAVVRRRSLAAPPEQSGARRYRLIPRAVMTMEVDPAVDDGMMEYGVEEGGYHEEGYEGDIDDLPVTQEDAWAVIR